MYIQLIVLIFTILGGIAGYYINYFLDKKKELNSENNKTKREMYKKFVSLVMDIFHNARNLPPGSVIDIKNDLNDFYKDYCLYSSPKVIESFGEFMQFTYKNPKNTNTLKIMKKLGEVIKSMRRELGLSNRGLGKNGEKIFRAMFKDFDSL